MSDPATSSGPITLAIIEDDRPTREALVALLATEKRFRCIGAFGSAEEAMAAIRTNPPAVVLVDINLPGITGIDCVARLKSQQPQLQILRAGANGYLLKKLIDTDLIDAIEQVHAGGAPMSMPVARKVVDHFHSAQNASSELQKLTAREREILELLASGSLYKQIGDRLGISFSTVRAHVRNIYEKLHVQSRTEATVKFLQGN
jgi:DNA-binding NarL/FixJ family response regulator